jgi:hypothetical protein
VKRGARGAGLAAWGLGLALAAAGTGAPPVRAAAATPLCRADVSLDPPRARVGQQVVYRLRIERREDVSSLQWERNLSFPAFRAEWLPGSANAAHAGEGVQVFEERRALFPTRAGRLAVPAAGLRCRAGGVDETTTIPGAVLEVSEPPAEGRPRGWTGLVGRVEVRTTLAPTRIALGASALLSVSVEGPANLWDVELDLAERLRSADLEVFERPRDLARDAGRRLRLRRYFAYDLVPRREGIHALAPVRLAFFDPDAERYATIASSALRLEVEPPLPQEAPPPAEPAEPPPVAPVSSAWRAPAALALAATALAGALALAVARRARRPAPAPAEASLAGALADAAAAERAGELARAAAALARGVREALRERVPGALALSSEEIAAAAPDASVRSLAQLLARLDRVRFGGEAGAAELRAVRAALEARVARAPEAPSRGC